MQDDGELIRADIGMAELLLGEESPGVGVQSESVDTALAPDSRGGGSEGERWSERPQEIGVYYYVIDLIHLNVCISSSINILLCSMFTLL